MYYPDHHVHTYFSADSKASPQSQIEKAIQLGMPAICFTEHMDFDNPDFIGPFEVDAERYFPAIQALQKQYASQIDIRIGVEVGLETYTLHKIVPYMQAYDWDFIIGSVHLADRLDPYYPSFFEGRTSKEAYRRYFECTLEYLQKIPPLYDVLGHLDFVLRNGDRSVSSAWKEWPDLMDEILKTVIDQGVGLDVNTGGMKNGLTFQHPHDDLLRRYRELGGELITLGSDAHSPELLGAHFPWVGEKLKAMGYKYAASFKGRKPELYAL